MWHMFSFSNYIEESNTGKTKSPKISRSTPLRRKSWCVAMGTDHADVRRAAPRVIAKVTATSNFQTVVP